MAQDIFDRKLAEIQIRQQIQPLTALSEIDQVIISTSILRIMMEFVLIPGCYPVASGCGRYLTPKQRIAVDGVFDGKRLYTPVPMGRSLAGRVAKERLLLELIT